MTSPARPAPQYVNPPDMPPPDKPYHAAVAHDGVVYVSGQVPIDVDGSVPPDFDGQVRLVMANLARALAGAGSSPAHLLRTTCYLTSAELFERFNALYRELVPEPYPARTTLVVALADPRLQVEIDAVAHRA